MIQDKPLPKYKVLRGKHKDGRPMFIRMDQKIQNAFNDIQKIVKKNWDYVAIVAGIPGSGKSTFAMGAARYLCPWFDEKYIAFTDEQFIEITNKAPEYSAVILDESFQSLNAKVGMSTSFLRIVNHLQIIRQKHLYIFLCLPNFFDLSKGVAIFRSSHLFVTYADNGDRGRVLVFDREKKRNLYIKGGKFLNYRAVLPNFFARFWDNKVIDEEIYDSMKNKHLQEQGEGRGTNDRGLDQANKLIRFINEENFATQRKIAEVLGINPSQVSRRAKLAR